MRDRLDRDGLLRTSAGRGYRRSTSLSSAEADASLRSTRRFHDTSLSVPKNSLPKKTILRRVSTEEANSPGFSRRRQQPAMRRPHAAWKTQSRQGAVSAGPKPFGRVPFRTEVLPGGVFRSRSPFQRCPPSRSSLDGCPFEPKFFRAVSSEAEAPSDDVRRAEALWTVALLNRSSSGRCPPSRSSLDGCPFEPKFFRAVSSGAEAPSDGVR